MQSDTASRPEPEPFIGSPVFLLGLIVVGALARIIIVMGSPGTLDVVIWERHAQEIERLGLVNYYEGGRHIFNHPPFSGWTIHGLWKLAQSGGPSFVVLLRGPFAALDAVTACVLALLAGQARAEWIRRRRFVIGALYWASPLAIIFSAHHGNTDSAVALSLVCSVYFVVSKRPALAGIALALGTWIKIPGLLAAPALFFVLGSMNARLRFGVALGSTMLIGYAPALVQNAEAVVHGVFGYSGLRISTTSGEPIWGPQVFLPPLKQLNAPNMRWMLDGVRAWDTASGPLSALLVVIFGWLRRGHRSAEGLATTLSHSYAIVFASTNFFAFQYLAWSLPLWLLAGWPMAVVGTLLCTAYIWGLYGWLTEQWLLLDQWRFIDKPQWPLVLLLVRNACVLFFAAIAATSLLQALRETRLRWRQKPLVR